MSEIKTYVCHSGGCPGSDIEWERACEKIGIKTISYSFTGHKNYGKTPYIMTNSELNEAWKNVEIASKSIKRSIYSLKSTYVRSLLCRNWFQVKHSDAIYAIGMFSSIDKNIVDGGTGWAAQMAVDNYKPVYLFEQNEKQWYVRHNTDIFNMCDIPILTYNFAGIGTRLINDIGIAEIKNVLKCIAV
jgi:hypothetical protein